MKIKRLAFFSLVSIYLSKTGVAMFLLKSDKNNSSFKLNSMFLEFNCALSPVEMF